MQVRSIEHLQTWLKRDQRLSNELKIQPLQVTLQNVQAALTSNDQNWYKSTQQSDSEDEDQVAKAVDFKSQSKASNVIADLAKKHHMATDIKKAVFQAIVGSEDYLEAFEKLNHLNLKKT